MKGTVLCAHTEKTAEWVQVKLQTWESTTRSNAQSDSAFRGPLTATLVLLPAADNGIDSSAAWRLIRGDHSTIIDTPTSHSSPENVRRPNRGSGSFHGKASPPQ